MEAWLKRMAEGTPLFDPTLHVYNSDEDPQEVVGRRVAAPFHAVKGKPESGEKWCVCWVTVHMHDGIYAGVLQRDKFHPLCMLQRATFHSVCALPSVAYAYSTTCVFVAHMSIAHA